MQGALSERARSSGVKVQPENRSRASVMSSIALCTPDKQNVGWGKVQKRVLVGNGSKDHVRTSSRHRHHQIKS